MMIKAVSLFISLVSTVQATTHGGLRSGASFTPKSAVVPSSAFSYTMQERHTSVVLETTPAMTLVVRQQEEDEQRHLQGAECPSIAERKCTSDGTCTCSVETPKVAGQATTGEPCYFCKIADGQGPCGGDSSCKDTSYCDSVTKTCVSRADKPKPCADYKVGTTFDCITDDMCQCTNPATPNKATTDDPKCNVCHAKRDGEDCSEGEECSPNSYCDLATSKCIPKTFCPTANENREFSCNPSPTCTCQSSDRTPREIDVENGSCYVCLKDGEGPDAGAGVRPVSGVQPAPGAGGDTVNLNPALGNANPRNLCPTFRIGESFECDTDSTCLCEGSTPQRSVFASGEDMCYLCHAKADGEACSAQVECSPNSYCDIATGTCLSKQVCPSIDPNSGRYSCNTNEECACGGSGLVPFSEQLVTEERTVTCHGCALPNGAECSSSGSCAPSSYCDEATGKCKSDDTCPERADTGRYTCLENPSCECSDGAKRRVAIERTTGSTEFCYVCFYKDNEPNTCKDWYECSPDSSCFDGGACLPRSTCVFTSPENFCTDDGTCSCPADRTKKTHNKQGGGSCYSCAPGS